MSTTSRGATASPASYGIGARFSMHPMTDDFVPVILDALAAGQHREVVTSTDDVSTFVQGTESEVLGYLRDVIAAAGAGGGHVVAHVLLSRGCPGEVSCALPDDAGYAPEPLRPLAATGLTAAAHWSLYPLSAEREHMAVIGAAIEAARADGIATGSAHFVTRLDGDLAAVLETIGQAWVTAGRAVQHVVSHATVSLGSPTGREQA